MRLTLDGERLSPSSTPRQIGLENGDLLLAFYEQSGGGTTRRPLTSYRFRENDCATRLPAVVLACAACGLEDVTGARAPQDARCNAHCELVLARCTCQACGAATHHTAEHQSSAGPFCDACQATVEPTGTVQPGAGTASWESSILANTAEARAHPDRSVSPEQAEAQLTADIASLQKLRLQPSAAQKEAAAEIAHPSRKSSLHRPTIHPAVGVGMGIT